MKTADIQNPPAYIRQAGIGERMLRARGDLVCFCRNGLIEYINPAGVKLLRADAVNQIIGHSLAEFLDPDFGALVEQGLDAFTEDEAGTRLKLYAINDQLIDVNMRVIELSVEVEDGPVFMVECSDITAFVRASESNRMREQRISQILKTVAEGIVSTDETGVIEEFNPAAEKMFGIPRQRAIGQNVNILMPAFNRPEHDEHISHYLTTGDSKILGELREVEGVRDKGEIFPVEICVSELLEEGGNRRFIGVMRDITDRKKWEENIKFLAHHDALTKLPNRHLFEDRLKHSLSKAERNKANLAVMFIDLDKFKPINDTLGHEAGDIVLKGVAERLNTRVRASDTVARVGGDEFVVILEDVADRAAAANVAKDMIASLTEPFEAGGKTCSVGASIGIAMFPEHATNDAELLRCADETMYRVKASGRNNYLFYEPEPAST